MKRSIEIFTGRCPVCSPFVQLVKDAACANCEITISNVVAQCEEQTCIRKVNQYGINRLPSVVINGKLLNCCDSPITKQDLLNAGIGQA